MQQAITGLKRCEGLVLHATAAAWWLAWLACMPLLRSAGVAGDSEVWLLRGLLVWTTTGEHS